MSEPTTPARRVKDEAEWALAELGNTREEAADAIRDAGLKARPGAPFSCALAAWMNFKVPLGEGDHWGTNNHSVFSHQALVVLPHHLRRFASDFDRGQHPDLQAPKRSRGRPRSRPGPGQ